ncbi:hypothetical protein Tco_0918575 [Tanacetum coccineum]
MAKAILLMLTTSEICSRFILNSQARNLKILHLKKRYSLSLEILDTLCLSGKTTALESLCLSQAQILWCMYHKKNVDYAYLLWEDFVYQVENTNFKRSNEMYYPRFTKVIVNFFMTKDSSIPRRNRLYGFILLDELTNEAIKDSESYKEYYVIALGAEPPKTKASVKKKQVGSDKTKSPPTAKGKSLKTSAKRLNLPRRSNLEAFLKSVVENLASALECGVGYRS